MQSKTRITALRFGVVDSYALKDQAKENQNFLPVKTFSEFFR